MQGRAADYQIAAWLMAACLRGLNMDETVWLTEAFVASGRALDFSGIGGALVDKHATGGVGDKTTLALAPMLAACGAKIAKLSGRGLGFTGGTIDKLEAIPGLNASLTADEMRAQVQRIGLALSCQTEDLAPADGKMYALRDVTATVDDIPLITASVVSKKIAAGASVIALDIKAGRGAFAETREEAQALAKMCRDVGERLGKSFITVISSMDQPLGYAVGNAIEVTEAIQTLKGQGPADLTELCLTLGAVTLAKAGLAPSAEAARERLQASLADGSAYGKFVAMTAAQGGDVDALSDPALMPQPARVNMLPAWESGYVAAIDPLLIAEAAKLVGAGRQTKESPIDPGAGVMLFKKVGDPVEAGETLVELHVGHGAGDADALARVRAAFTFSSTPVSPPPLILEVVQG